MNYSFLLVLPYCHKCAVHQGEIRDGQPVPYAFLGVFFDLSIRLRLRRSHLPHQREASRCDETCMMPHRGKNSRHSAIIFIKRCRVGLQDKIMRESARNFFARQETEAEGILCVFRSFCSAGLRKKDCRGSIILFKNPPKNKKTHIGFDVRIYRILICRCRRIWHLENSGCRVSSGRSLHHS